MRQDGVQSTLRGLFCGSNLYERSASAHIDTEPSYLAGNSLETADVSQRESSSAQRTEMFNEQCPHSYLLTRNLSAQDSSRDLQIISRQEIDTFRFNPQPAAPSLEARNCPNATPNPPLASPLVLISLKVPTPSSQHRESLFHLSNDTLYKMRKSKSSQSNRAISYLIT